MRVLLTGGQGYIGNTVYDTLSRAGHHVVCLDTGYFKDCYSHRYPLREFAPAIKQDVRAINESNFPQDIDAVVHLAALSNDALGTLDPELTDQINHRATFELAKIAKRNGVSRFIFFSSCSVYGVGKEDVLTEQSEINPLTAYAASKVNSEKSLSQLADENFSPTYLRFATAYGFSERMRFDLVVNNLSGCAFTTGKIKIMSDGSPWRPLIHIEDMAKVALTCLEANKKKIHNQAFNAGQNDDNYQVKTIAEVTREILPNTEIVFTGEHGSDSRTYRVSFNKLATTFPDLTFKWNLKEGIKDLITNYKSINLSFEDFTCSKFTRLNFLKKLVDENKINHNLHWKNDGPY